MGADRLAEMLGVPPDANEAAGKPRYLGIAIAPDITWHVAGLAKCIGAGLRAAYVVLPNARAGWPFAAALKAANVMASPLTVALATRWIEDGTADMILQFIRRETMARQRLATEILPAGMFQADPLSFNIWLTLPKPWTRAAFIERMRTAGVGTVTSDAFMAGGEPPKRCASASAGRRPGPKCGTPSSSSSTLWSKSRASPRRSLSWPRVRYSPSASGWRRQTPLV